MRERTKLALLLGVFAACWFLPVENARFATAVGESLALVKWYAREHVLLCLVPAFLIAGAISEFVSQGAVMRYLGPAARKMVAYPVAAVSGSVLAVCSCTVMPLFASIRKQGAGLGPAVAFLYAGPAINVLAIILTARVLGPELGLARAIGAIVFAVLIGLIMQLLFRRSEGERAAGRALDLPTPAAPRSLWQDSLFFLGLTGFLVFANWARPADTQADLWAWVYAGRWYAAGAFAALAIAALLRWYERDEMRDWLDSSWGYTKQMLPLLLAGVAVAGLLLGGPHGGDRGLIPSGWIADLVGGNSIWANLFASVSGALMYFATLTEVPILEGLIAAGMGKGPALALLLAGPALSLPNMLIIRSVLGTTKTLVYIGLVVVLSTAAGWLYGTVF